MDNKLGFFAALTFFTAVAISPARGADKEQKLKDAFAGKFYIGTAMNVEQILEKDTAAVRIIKEDFKCHCC